MLGSFVKWNPGGLWSRSVGTHKDQAGPPAPCPAANSRCLGGGAAGAGRLPAADPKSRRLLLLGSVHPGPLLASAGPAAGCGPRPCPPPLPGQTSAGTPPRAGGGPGCAHRLPAGLSHVALHKLIPHVCCILIFCQENTWERFPSLGLGSLT